MMLLNRLKTGVNSYHKQWGWGGRIESRRGKGKKGFWGWGGGGIRREMQNAKLCHLKYFQKQEPKILCNLHLAFCEIILKTL